jgi:hypothetical protein
MPVEPTTPCGATAGPCITAIGIADGRDRSRPRGIRIRRHAKGLPKCTGAVEGFTLLSCAGMAAVSAALGCGARITAGLAALHHRTGYKCPGAALGFGKQSDESGLFRIRFRWHHFNPCSQPLGQRSSSLSYADRRKRRTSAPSDASTLTRCARPARYYFDIIPSYPHKDATTARRRGPAAFALQIAVLCKTIAERIQLAISICRSG